MERKMDKVIETLILLARPAAGKSEIIKYLSIQNPETREKKFHVGNLCIIDDFPMLWTWFEEDAILTDLGYTRLHTTDDGYFLKNYLWDVLIKRINLEFIKYQRDSSTDEPATVIIEFSRGKEHGGYKRAFQYLSDDVLRKSAILHVNVSWEESLRKNKDRFNPNRPDSILEHMLPDEKLKKLYYVSDWQELTKGSSNYLNVRNSRIPYINFENEDDVTTTIGNELGNRLEKVLNELWTSYVNNS